LSSDRPLVDLGFGGLSAAFGDHIGHFYRSTEELVRLSVQYFTAGLRDGDKCTFFCQPTIREKILVELQNQGIKVQSATTSGQLFLHEGMNSAEGIMEVFSDLITETKKEGYRLIRNAGEMAWGLSKLPSTDELVRWEALYDLHVASRFPLVSLCHYDLKTFGGDVMVDALKTHPLCIIGGIIHKNPYYIPPEDFLEELSVRHRGE